MARYDVFASFYDAALERAHREHRALAAEALAIAPTMTVLDAVHDLPYRREHGGQIMLATGEKPR